MRDTVITRINAPEACAALWQAHRPDARLLDVWPLRHALAVHYGVKPFFLCAPDGGAILPAGLRGETVVFYGGRIYAERNGFCGLQTGADLIFSWLASESRPVRLLSWQHDPLPTLVGAQRIWDVPYNQYWELPAFVDLDTYLATQGKGFRKDFAYAARRFEIVAHAAAEGETFLSDAESLMLLTDEAFASRGRASIYKDDADRAAVLLTLRHFVAREQLIWISVRYRGVLVGLAAIVDDGLDPGLYLLNLYDPSINDVSAAALNGVVRYACDRAIGLDGLRGAFGLKPRYGFVPRPAYALVRDADWRVVPSIDLPNDERIRLYGRDFCRSA